MTHGQLSSVSEIQSSETGHMVLSFFGRTRPALRGKLRSSVNLVHSLQQKITGVIYQSDDPLWCINAVLIQRTSLRIVDTVYYNPDIQ